MESHQNYLKDAAINATTQKVPAVSREATVYKVLAILSDRAAKFDTLNYIYIVDEQNILQGVISIKELFALSKDKGERKVSEYMNRDIISVRPYASQEKAAHKALRNNIKAIPVTDSHGTLLGIIPNDKVLEIMHHEKEEDLMKLAGIYGATAESPGTREYTGALETSLKDSLKKRLPWLILGTAGGLLMANTISYFESTLEKNVLIAAFIPLMVYISNAVGQQITVYLIRDASHNAKLPFFKYFLKQVGIVAIIGLILGGVLATYSTLFYRDILITAILAAGVIGTVGSAIITGFLIPYAFLKLNKDPADASGPISTIMQDLASVIIYFLIASALI